MTSKKLFISLMLFSLVMVSSAVNTNTHAVTPVKVSFESLTTDAKKQILCLADNVYFEAVNEPYEGKLAVAFVTFNRLRTGNYADTICGVVTQKTKGTCQFSWYCDPKLVKQRLTIRETSLYNNILNLSTHVYFNLNHMKDVTKGATFYHADYVQPGWKLKKVTKIGKHIFYVRNGDMIPSDKRSV